MQEALTAPLTLTTLFPEVVLGLPLWYFVALVLFSVHSTSSVSAVVPSLIPVDVVVEKLPVRAACTLDDGASVPLLLPHF